MGSIPKLYYLNITLNKECFVNKIMNNNIKDIRGIDNTIVGIWVGQ